MIITGPYGVCNISYHSIQVIFDEFSDGILPPTKQTTYVFLFLVAIKQNKLTNCQFSEYITAMQQDIVMRRLHMCFKAITFRNENLKNTWYGTVFTYQSIVDIFLNGKLSGISKFDKTHY